MSFGQLTDRPIWLRPKASSPTGPIDGADEYKLDGPFEALCPGAHAIVTYGSNAAVIGMLQGIPSIILGNGVMRPISSTDLSEIENPRLASQRGEAAAASESCLLAVDPQRVPKRCGMAPHQGDFCNDTAGAERLVSPADDAYFSQFAAPPEYREGPAAEA